MLHAIQRHEDTTEAMMLPVHNYFLDDYFLDENILCHNELQFEKLEHSNLQPQWGVVTNT
jgi:hypothetical protein